MGLLDVFEAMLDDDVVAYVEMTEPGGGLWFHWRYKVTARGIVAALIEISSRVLPLLRRRHGTETFNMKLCYRTGTARHTICYM